jgi:hypothetical protein
MRAENPISCWRRIPFHAGGEFHYMMVRQVFPFDGKSSISRLMLNEVFGIWW